MIKGNLTQSLGNFPKKRYFFVFNGKTQRFAWAFVYHYCMPQRFQFPLTNPYRNVTASLVFNVLAPKQSAPTYICAKMGRADTFLGQDGLN